LVLKTTLPLPLRQHDRDKLTVFCYIFHNAERWTWMRIVMQTTLTRLDGFVSRLLFVKPQFAPTAAEGSDATRVAERTFSFSLMLSAVRCVLKYVLLPFVLPVVGLAGNAATGLSLLINGVAIVSLLLSVRRLWQINYSRKWAYLGVAAVALVFIVAFILFDLKLVT
jgi:hypothetical protein